MALVLFKVAFHSGAAFIMAWGYNMLETTFMDSLIKGQKGGHSQFLTIQSLAIACAAMVVGIFSDILPSVQLLQSARRYLLRLALLLSVVVSSIYWSLVLFAPSLILMKDPRLSEPSSSGQSLVRIPLSIDLALHASPIISLLVDLFAFEAPYTKREATTGATISAALFGAWYASWVEYCALENKNFPYPFLNNPLPVRVTIYLVVVSISVLSFRGISALHGNVYRTFSGATSPKSSKEE
ncbi:hypothetical protein SCHPADRAFT_935750 [Schizopora paradoxa]|uniref:FAR-17a/AIG1-like protein n=1 Tax=Schizopora paradoxa TaxID=27342 RepID=A0A0H2S4S0_9AGAM|nr:hypothetical protein SCHPADRAFT_935750 [Schizopora paradoxa]